MITAEKSVEDFPDRFGVVYRRFGVEYIVLLCVVFGLASFHCSTAAVAFVPNQSYLNVGLGTFADGPEPFFNMFVGSSVRYIEDD